MTQAQLAQAAGLGQSTVIDFERERRMVSDQAVTAIRDALEAAGVEFIAENGGGPGVRLVREEPVQDRGQWIIYARIRNRQTTYIARRLRERDGIALPDEVSPEMAKQIEATQWVDAREKRGDE